MDGHYLGVDIASNAGIVHLSGPESTVVRSRFLEFSDKRGLDCAQSIARGLESFIEDFRPDVVCLEGYAYARNVSSFVKLVEIGTLVRLALRKRGLVWHDVPPTLLKKYATGKGTAKKEAVMAAVKERWGFHSPSHDVNDAFVLARIAREIASGNQAILKGLKK